MTVDCERLLAHQERNSETQVKNFGLDSNHLSWFTRRRFIQAAGAAAALSRSGWAARRFRVEPHHDRGDWLGHDGSGQHEVVPHDG